MRAYIGFDDTDTLESAFGTGKLARRYENVLPEGCIIWGVVRQQLLVDDRIPYTSHNSSACVVVDFSDSAMQHILLERAVDHIERESANGSDPGLCVACEDASELSHLMTFGQRCTHEIVTQQDARNAAGSVHLSVHGGTGDGLIGAAAAVGLTASGWSGRFIEFSSSLRQLPDLAAVFELARKGIRVVSLDRDAVIPAPADLVNTKGWVRPRLWGQGAVLPVLPTGPGLWESIGGKRNKNPKST